MVIRAVVFDIGGVLEITPDLGVDRLWETRLGFLQKRWSSSMTPTYAWRVRVTPASTRSATNPAHRPSRRSRSC
jgi:hypothetical protein